MIDGGQQEMWILTVDGPILQQLIEYCYSGEIDINTANVLELTKAAGQLQFDEVKNNCAEFYISILNGSSCLGILDIAYLHNVAQLKQPALDFILHNFLDVKFDEFLQLSADSLTALLADDDLNVPSEKVVFVALMGWIKHDLDGRKQFLGRLLECVRLTHVIDKVSKATVRICALYYIN